MSDSTETQSTPTSTPMLGEERRTERGFEKVTFLDTYDKGCSIQESSRAVCEEEDGTVPDPLGWIWLGIDDPEPKIMTSDAFRMGIPVPPGPITGWMPFKIPEEVLIHTRMHLNEQQVRGLVARLNLWLETGRLTGPPMAAETKGSVPFVESPRSEVGYNAARSLILFDLADLATGEEVVNGH